MLDWADTWIPPTWFVMLAAAAGYASGPLLLAVGAESELRMLIKDSGPFTLWGVLIGVQTMVWILASPLLWQVFRRHRKEASIAGISIRGEVLPSALLLSLLIVALMLATRAEPVYEFLPHLQWKVRALTVGALVVALIAAASVWVIRCRLERLLEPTKQNLKTYSDLRADLDRLLAYLGAVVGLAVLSSAAMRNVVRDVKPAELERFHAEAVILYGLVLSLVLALVYLPTFAVARAVGTKLRDKLVPFPEPDRFVEGFEERRKLDDAFGLTVSATASFRAAVAILSPLLGGLASLLPKIGS